MDDPQILTELREIRRLLAMLVSQINRLTALIPVVADRNVMPIRQNPGEGP